MSTKEQEPPILNFKDHMILRVITEQIALTGMAPSIRGILWQIQIIRQGLSRETRKYLKIGPTSTCMIVSSLRKLEQGGYIHREKDKNRSIQLLQESLLPPILYFEGDYKEGTFKFDSHQQYPQP